MSANGERPGDLYNARTTWPELLESHGYTHVYELHTGATAWRRPGKDHGISATTNHLGSDLLYVFSTSTPFESERSYDKFGAYAVLEHDGDLSAAARELARQAYGDQTSDRDDEPPIGEPPDDGPPAGESRQLAELRSALLRGDEIKNLPQPEALIDGVIDRYTAAELFGPSGSYKTFIALSHGLCVSTGTSWYQHDVHQGVVLYVVGEGQPGIWQRVEAWKSYWHIDDIDSLLWLPRSVNLLDTGWLNALADLAAEHDPDLIVVETLSRSMPGANENAPEDMGRMVEALDQIRAATHATTYPIHHTGKDTTAGSRGHSSFKAAMDTELFTEKDHGRVFLKAEKQRDHPDGHTIEVLEIIERGDSCVLDQYHGAGAAADDGATDQITPEFVTACCGAVHELYESDGDPGPTRNRVGNQLRAQGTSFDDKMLTPALYRAVHEGRLERTPRKGGGDYYRPAGTS